MKREDLKGLGLEDSVIDSIMDLHGQDMAGSRTRISNLETTNNTLQTDLGTARGRIAELEKVDVASITQERDDYKSKYENSVIDNALSGYKFTSDFARQGVIAELRKEELTFVDGKIDGAEAKIKAIQKSHPDAFIVDDGSKGTKKPQFSAGQHGTQTHGDASDINALLSARFADNKYFKK